MCIIEKAKKSIGKKTLSWFSLEPLKKEDLLTTQFNDWKCRTLFKYENDRYIGWKIDLKDYSSLKLYGV